MPYIKVSDLEDVKQLSKNLRKEDLDEIVTPLYQTFVG